MTVTLPYHPPNPWPSLSPEAAEWDEIHARITDPDRERRAARFLAGEPALAVDVPAHLEHAEQLSAAGTLTGPDCSYFQSTVNWPAVRAAGCWLGAYKVSEGRTYVDPQHATNRAAVPRAGLVPLAYHYLTGSGYGTNESLWRAQADWYCSHVDPDAIHALDVEADTPAPGAFVAEWIDQWRKHFPNKALLVYSNRSLWLNRSRVIAHGAPAGTLIWHAGYRDGLYAPTRGSIPAQWAALSSWTNSMAGLGYPDAPLVQVTDHASVPGVSGTCDGNVFVGTLTDLRALATGVTDDMSAADVQAINAHTDAAIDARIDDVARAAAAAVVGQMLGSSGPTVGVALQSGFDLAKKTNALAAQIAGATDTLEASEASQSAALGKLNPNAIAQIALDKLGPITGGGADPAAIKAAVVEALQENLPTTFVAQPRQ